MNTDFTSTSGHLKNMSFKLATKIFCFRIGARTIFKQLFKRSLIFAFLVSNFSLNQF